MDLVSVIIPVYRVEKYLSRCIKSVVSQTYENIEVILVDDGSPDSCPQICDDWAKKDKRIKVIHKENGGLSSARNAGIERARGQYLAFIDSDDYINKEMIKKLHARLKKENSQMALCGVYVIEDEGGKNARTLSSFQDTVWGRGEFWSQYYKKGEIVFTIACNKLYSAELFAKERYDVGKTHEDEFIIHRLIEQCQRVSVIGEGLYYYRKREGSITKQYSWRRMDAVEALLKRSQFFAKRKEFSYALMSLGNVPNILSESYVRLDIKNDSQYLPRYKELQKRYTVLKKRYGVRKSTGILFNIKFYIKNIIFDISPKALYYIFIKKWSYVKKIFLRFMKG